MENDKLKSIVLGSGLVILLCLVALHPGLKQEIDRQAGTTAGDTAGSAPSAKAPDFAGIVTPNMSFFDLMVKCGLDAPSIKLIEKAARNVYDLRKIYPQQHYEIYAGDDGSIENIQFSLGDTSYIDINIKAGDISAERKSYDFTTTLRAASGTITNSLYLACKEQDIPGEIADQLGNRIFAFDIDFFTDMRKGDYFKVIYEERTRFDGLKKIGRIVAAEFYTLGRGHYAFLFDNENGKADYFDENGKSLRKQLLKAPLSFSRISSNFSTHRFHPVLHHYAPHLGVDYAAPVGTPVMATGNGTIIAADRNSANGRFIKIRHTNNYVTYYLHLSRFAKGIYPGARVQQGEIIGYVGMTGYATGPHLDYRIKIGNTFVNPRKVSLPPAKPITSDNMASFIDLRDRHLAKLDSIGIRDDAAPVASADKSAEEGQASVGGKSPSAVSH
ncbi:MAG: peptidoglycan DD-metalloendopeptidase family protein [Candidatus Krumholzibacteria bacterium]|nr:peptidoglycan DD-metalloendopeptidase family protein [Candidatus Krumholzibacteria bacterium]